MTDVPPSAAGWYADPIGLEPYRYWDGNAWTRSTASYLPEAPPSEVRSQPYRPPAPQPPPPRSGFAPSFPPPERPSPRPPRYSEPPRRPGRNLGVGCLASIGAVVVAGVILVVVLVVVAAGRNSSSPGVGNGTATHPAADDITITGCTYNVTLAAAEASGRITNNSSQTSTYTFTISIIDRASGTVVAQASGVENNIAPGQSATFQVPGDQQVATGQLTCQVAKVTRFASG